MLRNKYLPPRTRDNFKAYGRLLLLTSTKVPRDLGMSNIEDCTVMLLLNLQLQRESTCIPNTELLPTGFHSFSLFDPLLSSLIAPDHLLCGHFRNCLEFSFKTIQTKPLKMFFETILLRLLDHCGFRKQKRLLERTNVRLCQCQCPIFTPCL